MSIDFKPLSFAQWVNANGETLCELYDIFLEATGICPFEVSILDFEEEMYKETKHYLFTEGSPKEIMNILVANGGQA